MCDTINEDVIEINVLTKSSRKKISKRNSSQTRYCRSGLTVANINATEWRFEDAIAEFDAKIAKRP